MKRANVDPRDVAQCVFGNVIHTEAKDMYLSRVAAINGGLPAESGALTLNRLCGSGLQAIVSASQYILLGDVETAVAGGAESMSRAAYANLTQRWGTRMGDAKDIDMMVGALTDPFDTIHMGVTAENVATKCGITREQQDAFAVESHKRASAADRRRDASRTRSFPSSSRARRGRSSSTATSTFAATRPSKAWPS